jgi:hypothetical protein
LAGLDGLEVVEVVSMEAAMARGTRAVASLCVGPGTCPVAFLQTCYFRD